MNHEEKARIQALINELLSQKQPSSSFTERVYGDEPILRRASQLPRQQSRNTPAREPTKIRQMRKLCDQYGYSARLDVKTFLRQARFMADYEDNLPWEGHCELYYPSYESMTDRQLRGYFTWRSWLRAGRLEDAPEGFLRVYCYEMLNLVGVDAPQTAYEQLQLLASNTLDAPFDTQIQRWIFDFVLWYGLDSDLLPETRLHSDFQEQIITILHYQTQPRQTLCEALSALSNYRLVDSRFYKLYPDEVSEVVWQVFDQLTEFHEKHRKNSLCEHLIGRYYESPYVMFPGALMDQSAPHPDTVYELGPLLQFICKDKRWTRRRFVPHSGRSKPLGALLRQIDYCLRQAYGFKSTLKPGETTKVYQGVIDRVIAGYMKEKLRREQAELEAAAAAAKKSVTIDLSKLQGIRSAALVTQQKLIVDEEEAEEPAVEDAAPAEAPAHSEDAGLRLLRCLLYGQPLDWVRSEGLLLSVLVDSANERFYDEFADTVLEFDGDTPTLIEDYIDDLKGIIGE